MSNEDLITDDLTKNDDGQYVNKKGETVAVDSIAYRNERLEERKRDAIDDLLGKDTSTEVEDPNHARDVKDQAKRKAAAKKAKPAQAKPAAKEADKDVSTSGPTGTSMLDSKTASFEDKTAWTSKPGKADSE